MISYQYPRGECKPNILPGQAPAYSSCRWEAPALCLPQFREGTAVPVLQMSRGQKVTSLTACLVDQNLRLDCRYENKTNSPIQHEFSLTREKKKHVLAGTLGVPEHTYRSRTSVTGNPNIKVLTLANFTTKDEGTYACELRVSGQSPTTFSQNVSVLRGETGPQKDEMTRLAALGLTNLPTKKATSSSISWAGEERGPIAFTYSPTAA